MQRVVLASVLALAVAGTASAQPCVTVLSGVRVDCARYSPAGAGIAYIAGGQLYLLEAPSAPRTNADWCSFSPDGTRLVLERQRDLWIYEIASGGLTQLTATTAGEENPDWSRDGDRIAYCVNDVWPGQLMVYSFSTGEHVEIFRNNVYGATVHAPAWSPDGTRIVLDLAGLVAAGTQEQVTIPDPTAWIVDYPAGTSTPVRCYGCGWEHGARWHPGGEWLLLTGHYLSFYTIYAVNVASGQTTEVRYNGGFGTTTLDWHPRALEWAFAYYAPGGGYLQLCPSPAVPVADATWGSAKARFVR
jgi:Tol biopolymer transport system component